MLGCGPLGVGQLGLALWESGSWAWSARARAPLLDVRSEGCVSLREDRAVIAVGSQPPKMTHLLSCLAEPLSHPFSFVLGQCSSPRPAPSRAGSAAPTPPRQPGRAGPGHLCARTAVELQTMHSGRTEQL